TTGVLAASGTITQLVPPSLVLVVLSDQLRTQTSSADVGSMYLGAWGPSLMQIALFVAYTFLLSRIKPDWLPAVPKEDITLHGWQLWKKCLRGIIPSAVLIFMVLGTMMLGIATPTESGAMGALGAVVLAVIRDKEFTQRDRWLLRVGMIGLVLAAAISVVFYEDYGVSDSAKPFLQAALAATYLGIAWLVYRATRI